MESTPLPVSIPTGHPLHCRPRPEMSAVCADGADDGGAERARRRARKGAEDAAAEAEEEEGDGGHGLQEGIAVAG